MKKENFIQKFFKRIQKWYVILPDKKRYFELFTAILSIPMILTVILVNMNTINKSKESTTTPTSTPIQIVVENPASGSGNINNPPKINITTPISTVTPTKTECKKDIGEIEILSPQEGEIITNNDVCINISSDSDYCPVSWSYKLDDDSWSDYSSNNICLYNLTAGKKNLQIKVKSSVVDKTVTLERTFTYKNSITPTPTTASTSN